MPDHSVYLQLLIADGNHMFWHCRCNDCFFLVSLNHFFDLCKTSRGPALRTQHYARPRIARLIRIEMAPNIRGSMHQCSIGACESLQTQMSCVCSSRPTSDSLTSFCSFVFLNCVFAHAAAFATDDNSLSLGETICVSSCTHDITAFASRFAQFNKVFYRVTLSSGLLP